MHRPSLQLLPAAQFDEFSRTLAAPFRQDLSKPSLSAVIGSHYSPLASLVTFGQKGLSWNRSAYHSLSVNPPIHSTTGIVDVGFDTKSLPPVTLISSLTEQLRGELASVGVSEELFRITLSRYMFYLHGGGALPDEIVCDFGWLKKKMKRYLCLLWEQSSEDLRDEIVKDYLLSQKRAILNYILSSKIQRNRMSIPFIPFIIKTGKKYPICCCRLSNNTENHHSAIQNVSRMLLTSLSGFVACQEMMALFLREYASDYLIDIPVSCFDLNEVKSFMRRLNGISSSTAAALSSDEPLVPVDVDKFHSYQQSFRDGLLKKFSEQWIQTGVSEILAKDASQARYGKLMLARAISLLSIQSRELTEKSLRKYSIFISSYIPSKDVTEKIRQATSAKELLTFLQVSSTCFLQTRLTAKGEEIKMRPSLDVCQEKLVRTYRECISAMKAVPAPTLPHIMGKDTLFEVRESEAFISVSLDEFESNVTNCLAVGKKIFDFYQPYVYLLSEMPRAKQIVASADGNMDFVKDYAIKLQSVASEISENFPLFVKSPLVGVDCSEVNESLISKANECLAFVSSSLISYLLDANTRLISQFESLDGRLKKKVLTEQQIVDMELVINTFINTERRDALETHAKCYSLFRSLFHLRCLVKEEDCMAMYGAALWVYKIDEMIRERSEQLRSERNAVEAKFYARREKFQSEISTYITAINRFKDFTLLKQADDFFDKLTLFGETLRHAISDSQDIISKEQQLGWDVSEFRTLNESITRFDPVMKLWSCVVEFQKKQTTWSKSAVLSLNPGQLREEIATFTVMTSQLQSLFEEEKSLHAVEVTMQIKNQIEAFSAHLQIIDFLTSKRLTEAHWRKISDILGFPVDPDTSYSLIKFLDMGITSHFDEIEALLLPTKN